MSSRLKRLADIAVSNVDKKSAEAELPVRLCNYTDVYYNERITADMPFMEATASTEQIRRFGLRAGDVLLTKDSETPDDIAVAAHVATNLTGVVCGYHLALLRPRAGVEGRYLFWALKSEAARQQFSVSANGITRFGLRHDTFGEVQIPCPALDRQRAIADFLDRETARIDRLVRSRRRACELMDERFNAYRDEVMASIKDLVVLRRFDCEVQTGPFGSQLHAEDYVTDGWPVINPANLVGGSIQESTDVFVDEPTRARLARHVLQSGDLLFARRGQLGRAALVTERESGWLCGTGCLRVRFHREALPPSFLRHFLACGATRQYFEAAAVGSTMENLNSSMILRLPIPNPPSETARAIAADLDRQEMNTKLAVEVAQAQATLLLDRRQALITAAVTEQLDLPGVAG